VAINKVTSQRITNFQGSLKVDSISHPDITIIAPLEGFSGHLHIEPVLTGGQDGKTDTINRYTFSNLQAGGTEWGYDTPSFPLRPTS
jgi:hypothetical protein